jgi:hypothetical protein
MHALIWHTNLAAIGSRCQGSEIAAPTQRSDRRCTICAGRGHSHRLGGLSVKPTAASVPTFIPCTYHHSSKADQVFD